MNALWLGVCSSHMLIRTSICVCFSCINTRLWLYIDTCAKPVAEPTGEQDVKSWRITPLAISSFSSHPCVRSCSRSSSLESGLLLLFVLLSLPSSSRPSSKRSARSELPMSAMAVETERIVSDGRRRRGAACRLAAPPPLPPPPLPYLCRLTRYRCPPPIHDCFGVGLRRPLSVVAPRVACCC
jgi:hypothetical protein